MPLDFPAIQSDEYVTTEKKGEPMKTIKEHLMEADRNVLLTMLASRYVYEPENLKKNINYVVYDIFQEQWKKMDAFIDTLLAIDPVRDEGRIAYLYEEFGRDKIIDVMDLEDDFEMAGYSLSFPEWKYSLGYMVADNTQENIMDLLIQ